MTEKNIFAYKHFLSLHISDFNLVFMWKLQPPLKKFTPSFPASPPPKKSWGPVKHPPPPTLFENLDGGSERGDSVHTIVGECTTMLGYSKNCSSLKGIKASLKSIDKHIDFENLFLILKKQSIWPIKIIL